MSRAWEGTSDRRESQNPRKMSSSSPSPSAPPSGDTSATNVPTDPLFLETLMNRLQLRPPFLDTNSFLSHSLDDFLLRSLLSESDIDNEEDSDDADGGEDMLPSGGGDEESRRRALAKEEAKLEKEIVRIIRSGDADDVLKPNSGQSVSIGDHNICVAFQEETGSEYRVWEWHGHIMLFDYENGYSAEYIYGNYFERVAEKKRHKEDKKKKKMNEEEEASRNLGLRDLITDPKDNKKAENGGGRVLHRNALNGGPGASSSTEDYLGMLSITMWNNYVFPPLSLPGGSGFGDSHQSIESVAEPERFYHGNFFTTPDNSESFHLGAMFSPVPAPNSGFLTAPGPTSHQGVEHPLMINATSNARTPRNTQIRSNVPSDQKKINANKDPVCKKQLGTQLYKKLKIMCSEKLHDLPLRETPSTQTRCMKAPVRRSRKLGDKITALQQLVAPFGKTDTASVLREVAISIKDLHEQIRVLTAPYFGTQLSAIDQMSYQAELVESRPSFLDFKVRDGDQGDLQCRGLCLVPMSSPLMHFMNQACNQGGPGTSAARSGFGSY